MTPIIHVNIYERNMHNCWQNELDTETPHTHTEANGSQVSKLHGLNMCFGMGDTDVCRNKRQMPALEMLTLVQINRDWIWATHPFDGSLHCLLHCRRSRICSLFHGLLHCGNVEQGLKREGSKSQMRKL